MIRRNHKDRLFVKLFGDPDNKENLLSLYNALNDRNYDDPDELEINTIRGCYIYGPQKRRLMHNRRPYEPV